MNMTAVYAQRTNKMTVVSLSATCGPLLAYRSASQVYRSLFDHIVQLSEKNEPETTIQRSEMQKIVKAIKINE